MKSDCISSIYQYSQAQLEDEKFLKSQIKKYENKIKESKETTKNLKYIQDVYKRLLKKDPICINLYQKRKPVENPCKLCGSEIYFADTPTCFRCQKKARRKNKGIYQLTITCSNCKNPFYPKSIAIPYEEGDQIKCPDCKTRIFLTAIELNSQIRAENMTVSYPEIVKVKGGDNANK